MRRTTLRTSLDIPVGLHRRLHEEAARQGCSARQLILQSIEKAVIESKPLRKLNRLSLDLPIVPAEERKPFDLTNESIHDLIEFP